MSCSSCENGLWMSYGIYSSEDQCCVNLCEGASCFSSPFPTTTTTTPSPGTTTTTALPTTTTTTTTCAPFSGSTFLQYINNQCSCPCCPCPPVNQACTTTTTTTTGGPPSQASCQGCMQASVTHYLEFNNNPFVHDVFEWNFTNCTDKCANNVPTVPISVSFFCLYGAGKTCAEILASYGYSNNYSLGYTSCTMSAMIGTGVWAYNGSGTYSILMWGNAGCAGGGFGCACNADQNYCVIEHTV